MESRGQAAGLSGTVTGVALLPLIVMAVTHWGTGPQETAGDYAQYILHAKAILAGTPYADVGILQSSLDPFMGPRAFPPGLPLTIAPVVAFTGSALGPLSALMTALLAFGLWCSVRRLAVEGGAAPAALAAGFCGVSLVLSYATSAPISDPGFLAACWALILVVDGPGPWTTTRTVLVAVLGLAAMSYRVIGVVVVPVILLRAFLTRDRDERRALFRVLVAWALVLGLGGAILWRTVGSAMSISFEALALLRRVMRHAMHYPQLVQEAFLYPVPAGLVSDILHAALSLAAAVGLVALARRKWRSTLMLFTGVYGAALLVAHVKEPRYAWPLYPLIIYAMVTGLDQLLRHALPAVRARRVAVALACVVLIGGLARGVMTRFPEGLQRNAEAKALFTFFRGLDPATDRAAFHQPRLLTLETGIPAMPLGDRPPAMIRAELERHRITHLVYGQSPGDSTVTRLVRATIDADSLAFREVYRNRRYTVYRFGPG